MPQKATDITIPYGRFLIQGSFGAGKTYMVGLMHEHLKKAGTKGMYLFDFEKGVNTLASAKFDVDFDYYFDKDPRHATGFLAFEKQMTAFETDDQGYGGFAIDSLTSFQAAAMNEILRRNKIQGRRHDIPVENDYGVLVSILNQFFSQLLAISENHIFVVTAHVREEQNEITKEVKFQPAVTGKTLRYSAGGWFNEVWRLYAEGYGEHVKRIVQTSSGNRFDCKTQIAGMPYTLEVGKAVEMAFKEYGIIKSE